MSRALVRCRNRELRRRRHSNSRRMLLRVLDLRPRGAAAGRYRYVDALRYVFGSECEGRKTSRPKTNLACHWRRNARMKARHTRYLMPVAELAQYLNVSRGYVVKLLPMHVFGPVVVVGGRRHVLRAKAEEYVRMRKRIARSALRELTRVSQDARMYP